MARSVEKVALLISMFCCTSFAVYYTTGPQLDYPRLGKRNVYPEGTIFPVNGDDPILMSDAAFPVISNLNRRGIFTDTPKSVVSSGKRNSFFVKRGFFTRGSSDYPRIGKKDELWNERKKEIFTSVPVGLLRVGRSSNFWSDGVNQAYQKMKGVKEDSEDEAEQGPAQGQLEAADFSRLQASSFNFLFNEFDADNDGKLSKEEFSKGLQILKTQSLIC